VPAARILVLSGHPEEDYAVQALRAGAAGYLSKVHAPDELVVAVRRLAEGRRYISDTLAERLAATAGQPQADAPHTQLSSREFEVLRLMAAGRSLKEIGAQLGVHAKTVSTFRSRILRKLAVKTNAELVRYALEHHLVEGGEVTG
jgi:DNA-binding NarL/FixJ family response regulator